MPARPSERPSRAGSSVPWPELPPQPAARAAASARAQAAAVVLAGRRIGARILLGATLVPGTPRASRVHPRVRAEAGRLERLVAGDAHPGERAVRGVLEHEPQTLERHLRVALDPAGGAGLPDPVEDRG